MKLLTPAHANAKTAKNEQFGQYLTFILHLAPARLSGYNTCPMATAGCAAACLNTAGRGAFNSVQQARIRKTKLFFEAREEFFGLLIKDLEAVERKAAKLSKKAVVRLNGTSDLSWESLKVKDNKNIFQLFPDIQFYDYTKILRRLKRPIEPNYHLTFSRAESNESDALQALGLGTNVAVVFGGDLPETWKGYFVVDGDSHDLRFLDRRVNISQPVVVGLKAKGKARKDVSGFVVRSTCSAKAA